MAKRELNQRGKNLLMVWQTVGVIVGFQVSLTLVGVMQGYPSPSLNDTLGNIGFGLIAGCLLSVYAIFSKRGF
jgi:hypothetical protein